MCAKIRASLSCRAITNFLLLCAVTPWAMPCANADVSFADYAPFDPCDLVGSWQVHHLNVGDASAWHGWLRFELRVDEEGRFQIVPGTYLNSNGETGAESTGTMTIADDGVLSMLFDVGSDNRRAEGMMAGNRQLAVTTMDDERGSNLSILQKRSDTALAASDLTGTWSMHAVGTGDPAAWEGWTFGDMTIDANGTFWGVPGSSMDSSGYPQGFGNGRMSLTSTGVVNIDGWPSMHGTLSATGDLAVYTHTDRDGAPPHDFALSVAQKRSHTAFATGDLSGLWRIAGLSTRGGKWANWVRGTWTVNTDGSSSGQLHESDGTVSPIGGTVTMASYGTFRVDPFEYTHGVIGADRDLMVLVTTDSRGEHRMLIGMRTGTSDSSAGVCQCGDDDPSNGIDRICN